MKKLGKMAEKRLYTSPVIVCIELDNDISLALESAPPFGPGELVSLAPEYFNIDPFNKNRV